MSWSTRLRRLLDHLRVRLSGPDGGLLLAMLGLLCGLVAGAVLVAFRFGIETAQSGLLSGAGTEGYEALSPWWRLGLCVAGGILVGGLMHLAAPKARGVGIVHVLDRLAHHQAHLPLRNAVMQFVGASISIVAGHSVGREGPGVHLGAASGSLLGVGLGLPNNVVRTLVGCGVAASIAASFNTPLAGVIFAMEVVMMEYTISGFTPVILAAASAAALSRAVFGAEPVLSVPAVHFDSLAGLPLVLLTGLVAGTLAAIFTRSLLRVGALLPGLPVGPRMALGGLVAGLAALAVPEVMGVGYDTVDLALRGEGVMLTLAIIALAKVFATAAALGLGLPGGLIGPTLVIGATAGAATAMAAAQLGLGDASAVGLYALLGMGAMMAATLQAPLAALAAVLELTANPHVIMPALFALVTAQLVTRQLYRTESAVLALAGARGVDVRQDPVVQSRRRIGVRAVMQQGFVMLPRAAQADEIRGALVGHPRWVLVREDLEPVALLAARDLASALEGVSTGSGLDLLEIPGDRRRCAALHPEATLQEAVERMSASGAEALYVTRPAAPGIPRIYGVLTREDIDEAYRL